MQKFDSVKSRDGQHRVVIRDSYGLNRFAFVVGLLSFVHVNIVGDIYLSELALAIIFILLWKSKSYLLRNKEIRRVLFFLLLWFISQIITDFYRSTPFIDVMRGWFAIAVFALDFIALYMLVAEKKKRMYFLLFGYAIGWLVQPFIQPSPFFLAEPWKFGFGYPFVVLLSITISYFAKSNIVKLNRWVAPLILLGLLSAYLNSRSLGAFTILVAILIFLQRPRYRHLLPITINPFRMVLFSISFFLVIVSITSVYSAMAQSGMLGESAQEKYAKQSGGGGVFSLLLGGRPEIFPAAVAVWDSPLLGHGSWARDAQYGQYYFYLIDWGYELDEEAIQRYIDEVDLIPRHSHILQNWVWAGMLGAVFWLFVGKLIVRKVLFQLRKPGSFYVVIMLFGILSLWDIMFSPLGAMKRFYWGMTLTLFLISTIVDKRKGE